MSTRYVYEFRTGRADGDASQREGLGSKGANLAEMAGLGVPVPAGFTLTTEVCVHAMEHDGRYPDDLEAEVRSALQGVERAMGRRFGDADDPLLLSVRSGARVSMPGMMDTVLNIGMNDEIAAALAKGPGGPRWTYDCYRRFVQMYADVVMGMDPDIHEGLLTAHKRSRGLASDVELDGDDWRELVAQFKVAAAEACGRPVPDAPWEQLWTSVDAVFKSWNTPRALAYRKINAIPHTWGTAANVMAMVFGNLGDDSGTGVTFTRNPATGAPGLYGEFLRNAQGEDVVAGIRTPGPLAESGRMPGNDAVSLEQALPGQYQELTSVLARLERHYRDVQDVEFTVERGCLWILQTRSGKRTGRAAIKIALDLLDEGILQTEAEALARVDAASHVPQLLHAAIAPHAERPRVLTRGLAASPGAAVGRVAFSADAAAERAARGECVILVRRHTSADDVHGMHASEGILTATGGLTSHAAVVARSMGVPCVCGAGDIDLDYEAGCFEVGGERVDDGDPLTLDGSTGEVYRGELLVAPPAMSGDFARFMQLADRRRRLGVLANADTPEDARRARELGAEGIGLCRTEHMFFETHERLLAMRTLILAEHEEARQGALAQLLPFQRSDFAGLFAAMDGLPVTIRLLDPPLHEFLPADEAGIDEVARRIGRSTQNVRQSIEQSREQNPMLGYRGCRLGIVNPEIYAMQVRAILEGALEATAAGHRARPEIMVPLVALPAELAAIRADIEATAAAVAAERGQCVEFSVGTMIELPRAALAAGEIARYADFFSFGTNDLTQTAFGLSRDDAGRFLPAYLEAGHLTRDPFASLDVEGVGELIRLAIGRGRVTRPELQIGICGEHGGDPDSIRFCHEQGIDYVSCSPFRVPGARLAAAQAVAA
jgi:pyruvate,orthophosphate dikinase